MPGSPDKSKTDINFQYEGKPWERQPAESDAQFRAFLEYLNMPRDSRSHDGAYRRTYQKGTEGRAPKWFREWSWKNRWKERAKAFDQSVTDQLREEVRQKAVKLAETRLNAYQVMLASGVAILSKAKIAELTVEEARKLIPQAVRMVEKGGEGVRREMGENEDQRPGMSGLEVDGSGEPDLSVVGISNDGQLSALAHRFLAHASGNPGGAGIRLIEGELVSRRPPSVPLPQTGGVHPGGEAQGVSEIDNRDAPASREE